MKLVACTGKIIRQHLHAAGRGKGIRQPAHDGLEQMLGAIEIPQAMVAQGLEGDAVQPFVLQQFVGNMENKICPPWAADSMRATRFKRPAEIIVIAIFCRAGVDAHARGQRASFTPVFRRQCALRLDRGMKGRERRLESHAKSVADRLENMSAVGLGGLAHKSVMAGRAGRACVPGIFPRAACFPRCP